MLCHCDGRLVILVDNSWFCRTRRQVIRQLSQPDHLLSSICQRHVLCLSGGQSNTRLFLATPAHWCPTQTEQVTRRGLAVVNAACPVRITVSNTLCHLVFRVLPTHLLCTLQCSGGLTTGPLGPGPHGPEIHTPQGPQILRKKIDRT